MNQPEETTVTTEMAHAHDELLDQQVAEQLMAEMADLARAMFALLRPEPIESPVKGNPKPAGPSSTSAVVPVAVPMPEAVPLPDVAMAPVPLPDIDEAPAPADSPAQATVPASGALSTSIRSIPVPGFTAPLDLTAEEPGDAHAAASSNREPRTMSLLDEIGFLDD